MWVRMQYKEPTTGRERGYTAWITCPLDEWLEEKGIPRESVRRLWINGKEAAE